MSSAFIVQTQRQAFGSARTFIRCANCLDIPASAEEVASLTSHPSLLTNR